MSANGVQPHRVAVCVLEQSERTLLRERHSCQKRPVGVEQGIGDGNCVRRWEWVGA